MVNNIISGNKAEQGAGIDSFDGDLFHNVIYGNQSLVSSYGSGIKNCPGEIKNNIIWKNNPSEKQIWESSTPEFCCIETNQNWIYTHTSIYDDPRFVNPGENDFHLKPDSPCIDAGVQIAEVKIDYEGDPRPLPRVNWESRGDGSGTDIGADEFRGTAIPAPPPTPLPRKTFHIPEDFPTIQEAIDESGEGSSIIVSPGEYHELLHFRGKNITVQSQNPHDDDTVGNTIINGEEVYSVITFTGEELSSCTLSGFTITGGKNENGGGILGKGTSATIQNNVIIENTAETLGGGIYNCNARIYNNKIISNTAKKGGGLSSCHGEIIRNTIDENSARYGGGLHYCFGEVNYNLIRDNRGKYGGGLYGCNGIISYNVIRNNAVLGGAGPGGSVRVTGGGLSDCNGHILNNVIYHNEARASATGMMGIMPKYSYAHAYGGGLYSCKNVIQNNIIAENSAKAYLTAPPGNATAGGDGFYDCDGKISYCNLWNNGDKVHDITTCIAANPEFVNAESGDYRLKDNSPCIDAGNPDQDFRDAYTPPGKGAKRCDMGIYGGPGNRGCVFRFRPDIVSRILKGENKNATEDLDFNNDGILDVADIVFTFNPEQ